MSFVTADGVPIAARFGFECGGTYLGMKEAFDPAFASFAPGHLSVALLLEEMVARGLHEFDFLPWCAVSTRTPGRMAGGPLGIGRCAAPATSAIAFFGWLCGDVGVSETGENVIPPRCGGVCAEPSVHRVRRVPLAPAKDPSS